MIHRIAVLLSESALGSALAGFLWILASRARAGRKRRLRLMEMELRLAYASEAFHAEVFRLKHYGVLRPNVSRPNAGLIHSTNLSSLRYVKGREYED